MTTPPLTLYIHMPWCVHKCPYCDFNSHPLKNPLPEQIYIQRLIEDFETAQTLIEDRPIEAIFIGGGTPSLFSSYAYETLLNGIKKRQPVAEDAEITLEANPGSSDEANFAGYRAVGINRLSIGIQSFQDQHLTQLERVHSGERALKAITSAQKAGFEQFNIDLMHGLPAQRPSDALFDLELALSLSPKHLSWYELTLEPNTVFYKRPPELPDESTLDAIQTQGIKLLENRGYQQYEVSAYCQPGWLCKHNLNYWLFGDYLGIGAGSHSKLTDSQTKTIIRQEKCRSPNHYMKKDRPFTHRQWAIEKSQLPFEFMLNALRLKRPITLDLFEKHTGLSRQIVLEQLNKAQSDELIHFDGECFEKTLKGENYLNDLIQFFI